MGTISVKTEGAGANLNFLERKVLSFKEEFASEGVEIRGEMSLEMGGADLVSVLFVAVCGTVMGGLILRLIDALLEDDQKTQNVNIQFNFKDSNVTFNLPEQVDGIKNFLERQND